MYRKEHVRGLETIPIVWNYFINNAANKLHVILLFSPVSDKFA